MRVQFSSATKAALMALGTCTQTAASATIPSSTPARGLRREDNHRPSRPSAPFPSSVDRRPGQQHGASVASIEDACGGEQVASVLSASDYVEAVGCTAVSNLGDAIDGTTGQYQCNRDFGAKTDAIVVSNAERSSIVDGLRVYANKNCEACDPVTYKVEGRGGPNCYRINVPGVASEEADVGIAGVEPFKLISKGDLPWIVNATGEIGRNIQPNQAISSSYADGDPSLSFTEISWVNDGADGPSECRDYRISFGQAREVAFPVIAFGEVELFGRVTSPCLIVSPTSSPVCGQPEVANLLFPGDDVETFGCDPAKDPENAFDGVISSYQCQLDADEATNDELIVSNRRRLSVASVLRVYANDDCYDCDPLGFKVEGRGGDNCYRINSAATDEAEVGIAGVEPFKLIRKGTLPWADSTAAKVPRNADGATVGDDPALTFTEIDLLNDGEFGPSECRDYRVTFGEPRSGTLIKVGEVELAGRITNGCEAFAPTLSPVGCSGLRRRDCRNKQGCMWASQECSPDV